MKAIRAVGTVIRFAYTAITWISVIILVVLLIAGGGLLAVVLLAGAILGVMTRILWWVVKVIASFFSPTSAVGVILFTLMVIGVALLLFGGGIISTGSAHLGFEYREAATDPEIMSQYSAEQLAEAGTTMLTFSAIVGILVIAGWFIGFFAPFWEWI